MSITKFPAAFAAALFIVPRARSDRNSLARGGRQRHAQGSTRLYPACHQTATPLREPVASMVAIPKEMLRAQSALQPYDSIHNVSCPSTFDWCPLPSLLTALFFNCQWSKPCAFHAASY